MKTIFKTKPNEQKPQIPYNAVYAHRFLENEMATHSSVPAWSILWTEDPGRLESMGSQVGHNLVTEPPPPASFSLIY